MVGIGRRGDDVLLDLDPLSELAGLPPRATLDFSADGQQFWVAGSVRRVGARGAQMLLHRGPEPRPQRGRRIVPSGETVFAIFVAPGAGVGRRCQRVVDINTRGMRLESDIPFEPGTLLAEIVLVCGREIIRQGEGAVINCSTVIGSDGRRTFECGVRLRRSRALEEAARSGSSEEIEIDDLARVRATLWGLCDLEGDVTIVVGNNTVSGHALALKGDRHLLPDLRCKVAEPEQIPLQSGIVTVECCVLGSSYRFFARIADRRGSTITLRPAPKLREWHRRAEDRLQASGTVEASVSFRHPLERDRRTRRLLDLSSRGLSFEAAPEDEELWQGLPLKDLRLRFPDLTIRMGHAAIRSVAPGRFGVRIEDLPERDADRLRVRLVQLSPEPVELHDGAHLDELIAFQRSVNMLEPDMETQLASMLPETRRTWRLGHHHPEGLMKTVIVPWHGGIGATLTSVKAYDSGWILQHNAVASPSVPAGAGQLHSILMRLAAQRPDGEYVSGFVDTEAKSFHAMVDGFMREFVPPNRGAAPFALYSAPAIEDQDPVARDLRRLRGRDELIIEHVAQRHLHPVCARALGLRAGEVEMPRTRAAYRRFGLERGREAWGAFDDERCVAVLLREYASPGLCLSGLLSAGMLLPVLPERDPDGAMRRKLCEHLRRTSLPGAPPLRFLFTPGDADEAPILAAGFRLVGRCTLFAFHRSSIVDYQRHVSSRYGFLQARLRGRSSHARAA
jgi:hypothetical protein